MSRLVLLSGALTVVTVALAGCTSQHTSTGALALTTSASGTAPVAGASATGSASMPGATGAGPFQLPPNFQPNSASQPCLLHQAAEPTSAYMGGASATPALQLPFMAYLRANGKKAFCDGKPATDVDKKWAAVYVTLTSNPADVAGITK